MWGGLQHSSQHALDSAVQAANGKLVVGFLLIGSVFAPMIAIQIADFFLLHRDNGKKRMDIRSFVIWAAGFALYRFLMHVDIPVGNTLPDMVVTMLLCILNEKLFPSKAA